MHCDIIQNIKCSKSLKIEKILITWPLITYWIVSLDGYHILDIFMKVIDFPSKLNIYKIEVLLCRKVFKSWNVNFMTFDDTMIIIRVFIN